MRKILTPCQAGELDARIPPGQARFVIVHCDGRYTTNLPLAEFDDDDVMGGMSAARQRESRNVNRPT